jgi:hypothetical protein
VWLGDCRVPISSPPYLFSLYTMSDFTPPPLFPPGNNESNTMDTGGVIIIHGETPHPAVGPEHAPCHIHHRVDPDAATAQNPSFPDQELKKLVRS